MRLSTENSYISRLYFSNWGTETDPDAKYHNGNSDPRGYGRHIIKRFIAVNTTNLKNI